MAYVNPNGNDNNYCAFTGPCKNITAAVATGRPYVKLTGTTSEKVVLINSVVKLFADPGAKLTSATDAPRLTIQGGIVDIYDLEIGGVAGTNPAIAISGGVVTLSRARVSDNQGGGVSISNGELIVTRSTFLRNRNLSTGDGIAISSTGGMLTIAQSYFARNTGGISVTGTGDFNITNCIIYLNGTSNSGVGGVAIKGQRTGIFAFNTVVDNLAQGDLDSAGGVQCSIQGLSLSNNIIARNYVGALPGDPDRNNSNINTGSNSCNHLSSHVGRDISGLNFVLPSEQASSDESIDYRIQPGSSAINQATTLLNPPVTVDIDGNPRPRGAAPDQGAYEVQ